MITIYSKFNNLKLEKQEQIINAAIKEFVQSGFDKASTNEIVKRANISKGSLFNYFNSKKDLYLYLIEYSRNIIRDLNDQIDLTEEDLFNRIEKAGLEKFYVQQKHPLVFDFFASLKHEESVEVKETVKQSIAYIYNVAIKRLYQDIDYSKFRDEIDVEKAIEILNWTMFGLGEKALEQIVTFEDVDDFGEYYFEEWKKYAEILKYSFYKQS
ncbi:TetR/AcrR family transcriptional regulator [Pseudogracilibacillus sp. SO10305]|uniref:TetR/AcrR family transcriptional regulator n=1 Tax=Pseudogracilibacillus sp. SO10305 TaxID=3098292 RepID=UPI00300DEB5D